jgi:predicted MFS family arabinose efflux permease
MSDPAQARPSAADTQRLLFVLGLGAMAASLATRVLDPLVGVIAEDFAASTATVALLATAFALPYALVQPILGPVGDAIGKRRVIRVASLVLAVALAGSALAPDLGSLAVLRVIGGAAAGGVFPLAIALLGDHVPLERRQLALSRLLVAGLTGAVGGGAMAAVLEPFVGWRGVLWVCAAAALGAFLVLRDRDEKPPGRGVRVGEALIRYRQIWGNPAARALFLAVFLEGALLFGMFPFLAPILEVRGHGGAAEAGMAIAAFALGGFVFAGVAPPLLRRVSQGRVMQAGGLLAAVGVWAVALGPGGVAFGAGVTVAACLLLGLGFYMLHSSIQTRVTEVAPAARGSAVAMHAFSFFLGQALGPVVMGLGLAAVGTGVALGLAGLGVVILAWWLGRAR